MNAIYGVCVALEEDEIIENCIAEDNDLGCEFYVKELDDNKTEKPST